MMGFKVGRLLSHVTYGAYLPSPTPIINRECKERRREDNWNIDDT
jgi:hypothetical protein